MDVTLYNTLTRRPEKFVPVHGQEVRMYQCGPTVYDFAHIGNLRAYITWDVLRRVLEYVGYDVVQVMNITDIDDKTIKRSEDEGITLLELTKKYENIFLADIQHLNIEIPQHLPHATGHIASMIVIIEKLLREGFAYKTEDGVYFDITKSEGYGKIAELDLSSITRSRLASDEYDKKDARDFALWKFWTKEDGENVFDASFGRGRPGWHIECSAMAMSELGETVDIHTGGIDLLFPHHTNEIAQSEAFTGKPFVKYWMHNEFVMVDNKKMSKSLDNFYTLKTIIEEKKIDPLAYRYWVLGTHYRSKANFTWDGLHGAETALMRLRGHITNEVGTVNEEYKKRFSEIIINDLDTPRALALLWEVAKDSLLSPSVKTATILEFDKILGLSLESMTAPRTTVQTETGKARIVTMDYESVKKLSDKREEYRANGNWKEADLLREKIKSSGWIIEDTEFGPKII